MSKRITKRINYQELHSTGKTTYAISDENLSSQLAKISLEDNTTMPNDQEIQDVVVEITLMIDEISDIIDENPINRGIMADIEATMSKLETLRLNLRRKSLASNLDQNHQLVKSVNYTIASIKEYIKTAKDYKSKLMLSQKKQVTEETIIKERSTAFVIEDIHQNLMEIEKFINQDLKEMDDQHLVQVKKDAHHISDRLERISQKFEKILLSPITDGEALHLVKNIGDRYGKLNSLKMSFIALVNEEYVRRELDKDQSNKHINIKLEKFCGYESSIDIYTFRSNFENFISRLLHHITYLIS